MPIQIPIEAKSQLTAASDRVSELSGKIAMANKLYQLALENQERWAKRHSEAEVKLAAANEDAERLARAATKFSEWRNGPEGPDILFTEGTKLLKVFKEALAVHEQRLSTPSPPSIILFKF